MSFLIKVVIVLVAIVGLYYLMSPYQICMRGKDNLLGLQNFQATEYCRKDTSW